MVIGIGVDIVEVSRIERLIQRHGNRFLRRVFTERERDYCSRSAHPEQRYAARFAAKEAALKALGVGWQMGAQFTDVDVFNEELGAPRIALAGRALEISRQKGIQRMLVSISHDRNYAIAQVVAEGPPPAD